MHIETVTDLVQAFEILYDKATPEYEKEELTQIFSKAQLILIKKLAPYVDFDEKARKGLSPVIKYKSIVPSPFNIGLLPNGTYFSIEEELFHTLMERIEIETEDPCVEANKIKIVPITYNRYKRMIDDPFANPDATTVWRMDGSNNIGERMVQLITDGSFDITKYNINYIKKPDPIVVTETSSDSTTKASELDSSMYDDIVQWSVRIATGITNPEKYGITEKELFINN